MIKRFLRVIYLTGVTLPILMLAPLQAQIANAAFGPVQLIRSLQSLQDDIASGQSGALQMQPRLLEDIGQRFLKEAPSTWENADNVYAALIYLFNGGNPDVVETILKDLPDGIVPKNYIDGAIAYAHHQKAAFSRAFNDLLDGNNEVPRALLLSITLSSVGDLAEQDPVKASKRLNWVRLVAPGSLFEEAAIRRQLKVAAMSGDIDLLRLLTRNYVTRFSRSPYANEFWREFSTSLPLFDSHLTDQQLDEFTAYAPETIQFIIYLKVSRAALIDARMQRAHFGAYKAINIARNLQVNDAAARLYYAASSVGSTEAEEAGEMLKTISINDLPERDRPLLMAAQAVAKGVVIDKSILSSEDNDGDEDHLIPNEAVGVPINQSEEKARTSLPMPTDISAAKNNATKTAGEIEEFMQQAHKKLDAVDKLLEKKQ